MEWSPSVESPCQNNFFLNYQKTHEKQKLNFFRSRLFHMKAGISLKYLMNEWDSERPKI